MQLTRYWLTFPDDRSFPIGQGVTAHSLDDALSLLEQHGYDFHRRARRMEVLEIRSLDEVDSTFVASKAGPIDLRGIWYPCLNIGINYARGNEDGRRG